MTTIFLPNIQDTHHLGYLLGKHLAPGSTLLLKGDLGAGKTTLVQGIGRGLDIDEPIVSPTFTLINEYLSGRLPLYHLDLYRLEPSQVDALYPEIYWEGIEVAPGITAIEWSQRLPVQPPSYLEIELAVLSQGRQACLKMQGKDSYNLKFIYSFPEAT
ncbi:tRNA (adenosine(37)-N6)-threonylcarbamoyltransferase complex ATPase subunit type 1 TsaE [Pleurocapsales cyanobacterium LEGE 10410]|nr:tRNA (adenosine(37)-N6)-threonylcarbamoyltransferase complex ATPase subunit type 1 TsaE [Pleurocapsales cyanobacterium LEGE 10410]